MVDSAASRPAQGDGCERRGAGVGPRGFGVLETDEAHGRTVYQPFNQTTRAFGGMVEVANQGELYPSLSQDGAGDIYATCMYGGTGGLVALSYSSDGGKTWTSPVQLDPYNGEANVTSAVNGAGQGWVAWNHTGSLFAQPFTAADAGSAPAINGSGSSNGKAITVTVTCNAFPCTLAKSRFTITTAGPRKLTLPLKAAGKRFFKARHGTVKVHGTFAETFRGRTLTSTKTIRVKITGTTHH